MTWGGYIFAEHGYDALCVFIHHSEQGIIFSQCLFCLAVRNKYTVHTVLYSIFCIVYTYICISSTYICTENQSWCLSCTVQIQKQFYLYKKLSKSFTVLRKKIEQNYTSWTCTIYICTVLLNSKFPQFCKTDWI